jgi:SurA N-terminal domain/PPIC-type PPIASE domain
MLEFIRRRSTSFLSWIILGGIAVIFGLQFGLPSDSLSVAPGSLAEVHGEEIRNEDFQFQMGLASRFGLVPKDAQMRELVGVNEEIIDGMAERILLAHEARKMGLAATTTEAEDVVIAGHVLLFGHRVEWLGPDEKFNYEIFTKNWLQPMRVPEPIYLEQQAEELLAQTLRDLVSASVVVPEPELRRAYERGANTLALRYARYEFSAFADLADPTPAQLDAYVTEHAAELEQRYESQKTRFTALPKQARLQLVQVSDTPEERAALEAARTAIAAGTERLPAVARFRSVHDTADRGGDYGWMDEDSQAASDLPDAVRKAIPGVAVEGVSEVLTADGSLWLVRVVARREGDVPKEEAVRELAEEGMREQLGRDLARRAAEEDQNAVAGGTALAEVFSQPGALGETTLFAGKRIEDLAVEPAEGAPAAPTAATDPAAGLARPKAELRSTGPFAKGEQIPGLGLVPQLVDEAWAYEGEAELLEGFYEVPGALVLAGVESKQQASDEQFAEQRQAIYDGLQRQQASRVLGAWANRRCLDAKGRGDIKISEETVKRLTTYDTTNEDGTKAAPKDPDKKPHAVCDRVGGGGGFLTARLR